MYRYACAWVVLLYNWQKASENNFALKRKPVKYYILVTEILIASVISWEYESLSSNLSLLCDQLFQKYQLSYVISTI